MIGLLITHVFVHDSLGVWDRHVSLWFDHGRSARWNRISGDVTNLASKYDIAGVALVGTAVALLRRWGPHGFLLLAGLAAELSLFLVVNAIIARPRPAVVHLGGTAPTYSFPSGHTAAAFVIYGGIALMVAVGLRRWWVSFIVWTLALAITVAVAWSRVYRGEHYPTDVISGFLLGVGSLVAAVFIIRVAGVNKTLHSKSPKASMSPQDNSGTEPT